MHVVFVHNMVQNLSCHLRGPQTRRLRHLVLLRRNFQGPLLLRSCHRYKQVRLEWELSLQQANNQLVEERDN